MTTNIGLSFLKILGIVGTFVITIPAAVVSVVLLTIVGTLKHWKNIFQRKADNKTVADTIKTIAKKSALFLVSPLFSIGTFAFHLLFLVILMPIAALKQIFTENLPDMASSLHVKGFPKFFVEMVFFHALKEAYGDIGAFTRDWGAVFIERANLTNATEARSSAYSSAQQKHDSSAQQKPVNTGEKIEKNANDNDNQPKQPAKQQETNIDNVNDAAGVFPEDPTQQVSRK